MRNSSVALITALGVMASTIALGFAYAVLKRAISDYKATKAALKALRRKIWASTVNVIKIGAGVLTIVTVLVIWAVQDIRGDDRAPAVPSPTRPPAKSHRHTTHTLRLPRQRRPAGQDSSSRHSTPSTLDD